MMKDNFLLDEINSADRARKKRNIFVIIAILIFFALGTLIISNIKPEESQQLNSENPVKEYQYANMIGKCQRASQDYNELIRANREEGDKILDYVENKGYVLTQEQIDSLTKIVKVYSSIEKDAFSRRDILDQCVTYANLNIDFKSEQLDVIDKIIKDTPKVIVFDSTKIDKLDTYYSYNPVSYEYNDSLFEYDFTSSDYEDDHAVSDIDLNDEKTGQQTTVTNTNETSTVVSCDEGRKSQYYQTYKSDLDVMVASHSVETRSLRASLGSNVTSGLSQQKLTLLRNRQSSERENLYDSYVRKLNSINCSP